MIRFMSSILLVLAMAAVARSAETVQPAVPRFGLVVGQELQFEMLFGMWFDGPDGKPKIKRKPDGTLKYSRFDLMACVTAKNQDGSFRMVLSWNDEVRGHELISANLQTDGRITAGLGGDAQRLREIFPRLPDQQGELRDGWQQHDQQSTALTRYTLDDGTICARPDSPLHRVADGRSTQRYRLCAGDNLPERVQSEGYYKFYQETDDQTIVLTKVEQHSATWAERFDADARRYFSAVEADQQHVAGNGVPLAIAARTEGVAEKLLDAQRVELVAASQSVEEPLFRTELEQKIKRFDGYRPMRLTTAKALVNIAGHPSPAWKATDLEGKLHSVEQYRGQVVVLDFWFRGCSWCIRMMPQIEEADAHFRERRAPVAFLNVSIDKEVDDMQAVRDKMKLSAPVLQGIKLAEVYGVEAYPKLIVLDRQGVVRGIFPGFARSRRSDLIEFVEVLLAEKVEAQPSEKQTSTPVRNP
ncbi:MAG: TlpA family protein disulfide reductase [Planctomycetes bacterium]|nr:TlpA family protein disulfide reductase [Planctomycetota bacterium]